MIVIVPMCGILIAGGQEQNMPSCYISSLEKGTDGFITSRIVTDKGKDL